jgi:hypothetical protein
MSDSRFQRPGTAPTTGSAPLSPREAGAARAPAPPHPAAPARNAPRAAIQPAQPARLQVPAPRPTGGDPKAQRPSSSGGRVTHDERGNAVWEWVTTATRQAILSATSLLRRLDSTELSLDETPPDDEKSAMLPEKRPGGGFNPYEQANNKPRGRR